MVVSCRGQLLPSACLKWNTIYPLKYENEYTFQTFRLFLLFIKGPACVCNQWLSPFFSQSYQALYFNVVSVLHLTEISFHCIQTYFCSVSRKLLVTAIQVSQINYFILLYVIFYL